MTWGTFVVAAALLTVPDDSLPTPPPDNALLLALQAVSIELELLDPRETKHIFAAEVTAYYDGDDEFPPTPNPFADDLLTIRHRWLDLHDAPPAVDALRFPPRETLNDLLAFNRAYLRHLERSHPLETTTGPNLYELIKEVDECYRVWDLVRDASCDYYYIWVRRDALKKLRERIGNEAYLSGNLPPHVPIWRFRVLNGP